MAFKEYDAWLIFFTAVSVEYFSDDLRKLYTPKVWFNDRCNKIFYFIQGEAYKS